MNGIVEKLHRRRGAAVILAGLLLASGSSSAWAQAQQPAEKKLGWQNKGELALVVTGGNSRTSTFGFRNVLARVWENAELNFEVSGLRTETGVITRTPLGTAPDDFDVQESSVSALTAENYLARGRYDRNLSKRWFAYGSGGWDRNEFAGIRNRYYGAGGVGNIWYDRESLRWRTDYGVSVTRQQGTVAEATTFGGLRFSSDFMRKLSGSTTVTNLTIADENLADTSDLRLDNLAGLAVSMTNRLAIKVSLRFLFDNVPSLVDAELVSASTGLPLGITVPVPADKLDTFFNVALVVNF